MSSFHVKTYLYLMHYSEDASTMKFLVFAICKCLVLSSECLANGWLITNYGVLTSLEYPVWFLNLLFQTYYFPLMIYGRSLSASLVVNNILPLSSPSEVVGDRPNWLGFEALISACRFVNNEFSALLSIKSYATIPFVVIRVLDEVLITLSLCILLYGKGSRSAFPRTKRLMNMLVIYAINRCFLTLIVVVDYSPLRIYANSLLASLNTRQYPRAQVSGSGPDLAISAIHCRNSPKLSGDEETPKDGKRHLDVREMVIVGVAGVPTFDRTTGLRRNGEAQFQ
ncbi:hypothetical protein EDD17DRAFT_1516522 [Pisolithus thermaeus]|nr:hypothetical protein EV401DRAFT_1883742 [Pisolithus croceorrhizus]KAI6139851.1 hypothetical protein EDD17DRAFT_1516522 [Pisolithus thermaeus]